MQLQNVLSVSHLLSPKRVISIGTWNVRTLLPTGALHMLIHELERFKWNVIGGCKTHWTEMHQFHVKEHKIISVGKENCHRSGVALTLMKHAQWAQVSYNPVNDRILSAAFQIVDLTISWCWPMLSLWI